jgi:hypothetical protein
MRNFAGRQSIDGGYGEGRRVPFAVALAPEEAFGAGPETIFATMLSPAPGATTSVADAKPAIEKIA